MSSALTFSRGISQNCGIEHSASVSCYESAQRVRVRACCLRTDSQLSIKDAGGTTSTCSGSVDVVPMSPAVNSGQANAATAHDQMRGSIPARASVAVAVAHWTGRSDEVEVPSKWMELHSVFWLHPTPMTAISFIIVLLLGIWLQSPIGALDGGACLLGVAIWAVQEWAIHKHLFHGHLDWFGKEIHIDHHKAPYYHISIDDAFIAVGVMLLSTIIFSATLGTKFGMDTSLGYIVAGLCYQFTHYSVHCRFVPTSKLARRIRSHHMQHHCRNENYWLSFTLPQIDSLMNTNPSPASVPMTDLAKAAVQNKR